MDEQMLVHGMVAEDKCMKSRVGHVDRISLVLLQERTRIGLEQRWKRTIVYRFKIEQPLASPSDIPPNAIEGLINCEPEQAE
jgi:hypothetical protein